MWPENGFLDDFVCHTYGYETTNLFAIWTAISGLASVVQRDAYLNTGKGMFANFYTILVAPPGVAHKSTAMHLLSDVEERMMKKLVHPDLLARKTSKVIRGKATAEAVFDAMKNRTYISADGSEKQTDAKFIGKISELTTFLSKANYNATLVDKITDFYDCKSYDTDFTRGGDGEREIRNIFATFLGCTTPDALDKSIPAEAFGGGFMSRCMVVNQDVGDLTRIIPKPGIYSDCPDEDEMSERLLWLACNKQGAFDYTPEAWEAYESWYETTILSLRAKVARGETDHRDSRKTLQVEKLALMMALQRYDRDRSITLEDFQYAVKLYEYTNGEGTELINKIYFSGIEDGDFCRIRDLVRRAGKEGIWRNELTQKHHFKAKELNGFLEELRDQGVADEIREETGETTAKGKTAKAKKWIWTGK